MGLRFKFNVLPSLLPGEKVLFFKKWVWFSSGKAFPNYRVLFSLPPLWEAGVFVTDRRVLLVAHFLRLLTQEWSQWFDGNGGPADSESVRDVSVGKSRLLGPYLEVVSEDPAKRWYRWSHKLRLHLFLRDPESIRRIIAEAMYQPR